jgi:hypothetical protein
MPHNTVIETYLHSRHLELPAGDAVIRHHPRIGLGGDPEAIMVALMRHVVTDHPVAVHRTYIDHSGRKTERKVLGPCGGVAIKLAAATEVLVVAEGIETALAAIAAGMTPVWAMGSAGAIGALKVLPTVATLVILAEIDGGANREAISSCARRWLGNTGKNVFVVTSARILPRLGRSSASSGTTASPLKGCGYDAFCHLSAPWNVARRRPDMPRRLPRGCVEDRSRHGTIRNREGDGRILKSLSGIPGIKKRRRNPDQMQTA